MAQLFPFQQNPKTEGGKFIQSKPLFSPAGGQDFSKSFDTRKIRERLEAARRSDTIGGTRGFEEYTKRLIQQEQSLAKSTFPDIYGTQSNLLSSGSISSSRSAKTFISGGTGSPGFSPQLPTLQNPQSSNLLSSVATDIPAAPTLTLPEFSELPLFALPERNEARVGELASKAAAPGLRLLGSGLERGLIASRDENPNVEALKQGEILKNFGLGISDITSSAHMVALQQYNAEFGDLMKEAVINYQAKLDDRSAQYLNSVQGAFTQYSTSFSARESALGRFADAERTQNTQAFNAAMTEYNAAMQLLRDSIQNTQQLKLLQTQAQLDVSTFSQKKSIDEAFQQQNR